MFKKIWESCAVVYFPFDRLYLWVFLDRHDRPDRQPHRLLVVDVDELGLAPGGLAAALDAGDLWK